LDYDICFLIRIYIRDESVFFWLSEELQVERNWGLTLRCGAL